MTVEHPHEEASLQDRAVLAWMTAVPPAGLVAIWTLAGVNAFQGGELNRRIVSTPELFQAILFGVLILNATAWVALIRIGRLPLPWRERLELMAWCAFLLPVAAPALEWIVMPARPRDPRQPSSALSTETDAEGLPEAVSRFQRVCWVAAGVYLYLCAVVGACVVLHAIYR